MSINKLMYKHLMHVFRVEAHTRDLRCIDIASLASATRLTVSDSITVITTINASDSLTSLYIADLS